jgi:hypothetical protein
VGDSAGAATFRDITGTPDRFILGQLGNIFIFGIKFGGKKDLELLIFF